MGHIRLGALPRTRHWAEVVALLAGGAGAVQIANAAIRAAERDLAKAGKDAGLIESVLLLAQLPLAAQSEDFVPALRRCNLDIPDAPGLMDLLGAFAASIDTRLPNNRGRTDLGEMAQMAAIEAFATVVADRTLSLFGTSPDQLRDVVAGLGTEKQFGGFARTFFSRLTYKVLTYFLSRALADHTGDGRRFTTLAQQMAFSRALETHCHEATVIVEQYAGEWLSKTQWENGGAGREAVIRFADYAVRKIVSELKEGARTDAA